MERRAIKVGKVYEIDVKGRIFPARIRSFTPSRRGNGMQVDIEPLAPSVSWLHCSPRSVLRPIEQSRTLSDVVAEMEALDPNG